MTRRRILWSGGFDSTYLVLDALRRGDEVEPYYIQQSADGQGWQKQRREQEAIARVVAMLPPEYRRRLVKLPNAPALKWDWQLFGEFGRLAKELGERTAGDYAGQTPLLGAVADLLPGVEAAFVDGDHSATGENGRFLAEHGILYPMADTGKRELWRRAVAGGFGAFLALTWSCEADDGRARLAPCGACEPCKRRVIPQRVFVG